MRSADALNAVRFALLHRCRWSALPLVVLSVCFSVGLAPAQAAAADATGVVLDEAGGGVAGAEVVLRNAQGTVLGQATTGPDGFFTLGPMPPGSYWLDVEAPHFEPRRTSVAIASAPLAPLAVVLSLQPFQSEVTVTAQRGTVGDVEQALPIVTVRDTETARQGPLATIANALDGAPGVMVQQSTYGQASPFLRGLTGYHVLNLLDGVRFNNSTFRSGPNQYLAFADPSQAQRIEAMLGPASSQFGSDALGGAIQLLTPAPRFGVAGLAVHGGFNLFGATGDFSRGADASITLSGSRASFIAGGSGGTSTTFGQVAASTPITS